MKRGEGDPEFAEPDATADSLTPGRPPIASADVLDPAAGGFLIGLLVGEGHFGGDGKQAHVILRMHARHEATFRWLVRALPGSRLYGPYDHGGRHYYQWMCRGRTLWEGLVPLIDRNFALLDDHVAARYRAMIERYGDATRGQATVRPGGRPTTENFPPG